MKKNIIDNKSEKLYNILAKKELSKHGLLTLKKMLNQET